MRSFRSQLGLEMASKRQRRDQWGRGRGKGGYPGPSQEEARGNDYWLPGHGYEDNRRPEAKGRRGGGRQGQGRGSRLGWTEEDARDRHFAELDPWLVWRVVVHSDLSRADLANLKQVAADHECTFSMRKDR